MLHWSARAPRHLKVALAALVLTSTGCSPDDTVPSVEGSLQLSTAPGQWCLDTLDDTAEYTFGAEQIQNSGGVATVTDVELKNTRGFKILGVYTSPVDDGSLGVFSGWKGNDRELQQLGKVEASSEEWLTLRLEVDPSSSAEASFEAVVLTYEQGGDTHIVTSSVGFTATRTRC